MLKLSDMAFPDSWFPMTELDALGVNRMLLDSWIREGKVAILIVPLRGGRGQDTYYSVDVNEVERISAEAAANRLGDVTARDAFKSLSEAHSRSGLCNTQGGWKRS